MAIPGSVLTEKRSVTLPADIIANVQRVAGDRGFSAFTADALRLRLAHENIAALDDEMTERFGPPSADGVARVREEMRAALAAVGARS